MKSFSKEALVAIRENGATETERDLAENLLSMWETLRDSIDSSMALKDELFDALNKLGRHTDAEE